MSIDEYADVIQAELVIRRYPNQHGRWIAEFEGAEIKGDGVLVSSYGNGTSPSAAVADYVRQIRGKTLVFGAYTDRRREFGVPDAIGAGEGT